MSKDQKPDQVAEMLTSFLRAAARPSFHIRTTDATETKSETVPYSRDVTPRKQENTTSARADLVLYDGTNRLTPNPGFRPFTKTPP